MKLYLDFEKPLSEEELDSLNTMLERRLSNEPLQFIQEKANFFGYEFLVDRRVLIPRPETEVLVENVLEHISSSQKKKVEILEIGTGSGCIPITLAKELDKRIIDYDINSIDISEEALEVARLNFQKLGPFNGRLEFYRRSFFDIPSLKRNVDYIVSNPPYVSLSKYENLSPDIKDFEPESSLTDGSDGLSFYRKISELISPEVFKGELFSEMGFGQKESIEMIMNNAGIRKFRFINDYSGIPRIIHVSK
jgi:release factor glutamine methyltransferase